MRFDTMIDTVLQQVPADSRTRVAAWRQLIDIVAQRGQLLDPSAAGRALHALAVLRPAVPEAVRRASALSIARRCRYAPLVAFLGADTAPVMTAIMREAQLSPDDWLDYLPVSNPSARAVLRGRTDLPDSVVRALASLGSQDLRIGDGRASVSGESEREGRDRSVGLIEPETDHGAETLSGRAATASHDQISDLKRRIATFRARQMVEVDSAQSDDDPSIEEFAFECGPDGQIIWVDGIPRATLVGISIAEAAFGNEPGVDASAVGGFRRRTEIANARLLLEPTARYGGEWRFSAVPMFDPISGQFNGYRARARRPHHHEMAQPNARLSDSRNGDGDSMRQLIHELRSPLNAISGFAQMIEGQLFGPVANRYRVMAQSIVADAARLQMVIDDLDTAARGQQPATGASRGDQPVDAARLLHAERVALTPLLRERGASLRIETTGALWTSVAESALKRMVGRLLVAICNTIRHDEVVDISGSQEAGTNRIVITVQRPAAICGVSPSQLLDPGYSPDGEAPNAAMLSMGFSLRLVGNLAAGAGGALALPEDAVVLTLPAARVTDWDASSVVPDLVN